MAEPFIGEIRLFAVIRLFPSGWMLCNGQEMLIAQNNDLYQVIGTTYGGDGVTTFNLPNLQARVPMHPGPSSGPSPYVLGQAGGSETVSLTTNEMPPHSHAMHSPVNSLEANVLDPTGAYLANSGAYQYATQPTDGLVSPLATTGQTGRGEGHPNLQPYLCVNFMIALEGIVPKRP